VKRLAALAALAPAALLATVAPVRADDIPAKPADVASVPETVDAIVPRYPPPLARLGPLGFGLAISGGAWGAAFACAYNWPLVPGSAQLKIPVVGPWIALGKSGCASDDPLCSAGTIGVRGALYAIDGIAQVAGLALIVEGIVMKTEAPADAKKDAILGVRWKGLEVSALPVVSPSLTGLGLTGSF
jgi:hypothetical protein